MASWLITVKAGDIGAFAPAGSLGRHKIDPAAESKQDHRGGPGGLAFASLAAWATFAWLLAGHFPPETLRPARLGVGSPSVS